MSQIIQRVTGRMVPIPGDDVDTDRIIPARYLKEITFDNMGEYLFYDVRYMNDQLNPDFELNKPQFSGATIMVVGKNFGCGSSREHAPQAIKRAGFTAIIGESFAEIFSGNCKSLGLVTVTISQNQLVELMTMAEHQPDASVTIDVDQQKINVNNGEYNYDCQIKPPHRHAFLNGTWDELALLSQNDTIINERAASLPYFHW